MSGTDRRPHQSSTSGPPGYSSHLRYRFEKRFGNSEPYLQETAAAAALLGDVVGLDDGREFESDEMVATLIYRAALGDELESFEQLRSHLVQHPAIASHLGISYDSIPSADTFRYWHNEKLEDEGRRIIQFHAIENVAEPLAERLADRLPEARSLVSRHQEETDDRGIPEHRQIEEAAKKRAFNEFDDLFNDLIDYDRAQNASIEKERMTELAAFIGRNGETLQGGRDVYVHENDVSTYDYFSAEALAQPIRALSERLAEERYAQNHAIVEGEDTYQWALDPMDTDYGEGESWHKRTEEGIERQVEMLQSRGMLDRPVDIAIDGTAREYHKRSDTDVEEPPGVNRRYQKFDTGYAYEDITLTAIYRGRAIVLASFSYVPANSHFQATKYLIDRARDLVNVRNVYADSEYATEKITSYINHVGLDYAMKKRETSKVKDALESMTGSVDWVDYEIQGGDRRTHGTTLVGVEKRSKHYDESNDSGDEDGDGTTQATLLSEEEHEALDKHDEDLYSFDEPDADVDYVALITSLDVERAGIDPALKPVGHDRTGTAWGVSRLYRKRWSVETAFRDLKNNFLGKTRSRNLGLRRFFFMLMILLYNSWVLLNIIVANESDERDDDEIIWRKKIFVIDLYEEVFADREYG